MKRPLSTQVGAPYRGRRTLVTGASGFIGSWVSRALSDLGATVLAVGRSAVTLDTAANYSGFVAETYIADLSQPGEFRRLYLDSRPEITFNLAGYGVDRTEHDETMAAALNTRLATEIVDAIGVKVFGEWQGLRLVHTGSAFEYGAVEGPVSEGSLERPSATYGRTKLQGTHAIAQACQSSGLSALTARLFTVYGPGEHETRLLPSLIRLAKTNESLKLTEGRQRRDFTHVYDVVEGLLRLGLIRKSPGVVNLATGQLTSIKDFASCAAELLELGRHQLEWGALPYRRDEVKQGSVDVSRLDSLVGWKPEMTIRQGISATIEIEFGSRAPNEERS